MSDPIHRTTLTGALERICRSGERALAQCDNATAAVAVEAGKRLQAHPGALELIDSMRWYELRARLRDLARRVGPLNSELLEEVPRALEVAMRGKLFDAAELEADDECRALLRRRANRQRRWKAAMSDPGDLTAGGFT